MSIRCTLPVIAAWRDCRSPPDSRPRALLAAAGPRRLQLRATAFRDTHRAKRLDDTATNFAHAWATGHCLGPTEPVMQRLEQLCDSQIRVRASHPLGSSTFQGLMHPTLEPTLTAWCSVHQGLDGLRDELAHDQQAVADAELHIPEVEIVLTAASDSTNTAYCLVRLPGISAISHGARAPAAPDAYLMLKLDIVLDDGRQRVTSVLERGQLVGEYGAGDVYSHGEFLQPPTVKHCTAVPFPRALLKPWAKRHGLFKGSHVPGSETLRHVQSVLSAWVGARDSRNENVQQMLDFAGCDQDFQLIDGYGCLPILCQPSAITLVERLQDQLGVGQSEADREAEEEATSTPAEDCPLPCVLSLEMTKQVMDTTKAVYDVDCRLVDTAVCVDAAAAFSHWKAKQRNHITGVEWEVEGMEVDLLDPVTGNLKAVYMFSDSMDFAAWKPVGGV